MELVGNNPKSIEEKVKGYTLYDKLKEIKESVSNEPENVHLHKKHKRKEMDWDR